MRYSEHKCDGCQKAFTDDDDIVVCPECATPQHRECYDKNGKCVNAHLHCADFQWRGEKVPAQKAPDETPQQETEKPLEEPLVCPNCKHENPHGSTVCQNCGMKFTLFGFNLAEAVQEEEREEAPVNPDVSPKMTPPDYPPPFTVGSENGSEKNELPANRDEQMEQFLSHTISNASGYDTADNQDNDNLFKGPYPDDMKIDGIPANTMGAFIARDSQKYIDKFRWISQGHKLSFNWAAFFFNSYWFFYRKLYKPGIIFMTIQFCLSIIFTPSMLDFLEFVEYTASLDLARMTEAAASELMTEMMNYYVPIMIYAATNFVIGLIAGFSGNHLYKKYALTQLRQVEAEPNRNQKLSRILKYGGVAPLAALLAYIVQQLLSTISGLFF